MTRAQEDKLHAAYNEIAAVADGLDGPAKALLTATLRKLAKAIQAEHIAHPSSGPDKFGWQDGDVEILPPKRTP